MPNELFGGLSHNGTPPFSDIEEEKVEVEPRTPAEYALHAVFFRFATAAEAKVDNFLRQSLVRASCSACHVLSVILVSAVRNVTLR